MLSMLSFIKEGEEFPAGMKVIIQEGTQNIKRIQVVGSVSILKMCALHPPHNIPLALPQFIFLKLRLLFWKMVIKQIEVLTWYSCEH